MRWIFAAILSLAFAAPALADTPSQIVDKVKRDNPRSVADATLQGSTLNVGHRNPRGNMDGFAEVICTEAASDVHRVQIYDIKQVMKGEWKTLGAADCATTRSRFGANDPPPRRF